MKNKIFIVLLLCIAITAGLIYSKNGDTAQHSIPKMNVRALRSAVYRIQGGTLTLVFDENSDALKELINLAEQGDLKVQCWLGKVYDERHNVAKAVKWYSKAGDQKNEEALSYLYNIAQKFNNQEAFQCLLRNADDLATKRRIGCLYENKKTNFYNPTEAQKYFDEIKEAANNGNSEAQYQLGIMYVNGQGVEKSLEKAIECYKKATEQNNANALFALGRMYDSGNKVLQQDKQKAFNLYLQVAKNNHPDELLSRKWTRKSKNKNYFIISFSKRIYLSSGESPLLAL